MYRRTSLLLLLAVSLLGVRCPRSGVIRVVLPGVYGVITSFEFDVVIELSPDAVPATLAVQMNGEDVTSRFTPGGSGATAHVVPGAPLRDHCQLTATVEDTAGRVHLAATEFDYLPPKARIAEIVDPSQLLAGPLAQGRLGDWRIENAVVAFVIQDAPLRDLNSTATFGGNLIDAVRKDAAGSGPGAGLDHFQELQPMANIETVLDAETVEVVNDGQDGTAAILRVTGPDDAWDYLNISAQVEEMGLDFPDSADDVDQTVVGTTDYVLEPGKPYLRLETTWTDTDGTGGDIGMYVGDMMATAGELDTWLPSFGVGDAPVTAGLPSGGPPFNALFRTKATFVGQRSALGASYGFIPIELVGSPFTTTTFTTSGVTTAAHSLNIPLAFQLGSPPTFVVPEGGSNTHVRYFAVGTGDGGSIIDAANDIFAVNTGTLRGCVTVGGVSAGAGAEVAVDVDDGLVRLDVLYQTREDGCYGGTLPARNYRVAGHQRGAPYEGGAATPLFHALTVTAGTPTVQDIALPPAARLRVEVSDETGGPSPARLTVIGADPSPNPALLHNTGLGGFRLGLFEDGGYVVGDPANPGDDDGFGVDGLPFGVVRTDFVGASGVLEMQIEPGSYRVVVSRGGEYSARFHDVSIDPGETEVVTTRIARVLDTPGFISSDYHVHLILSTDSPVSAESRVHSMAAEGIENIISTEHQARTPLGPVIATLGLEGVIHSTLGEEITTAATGHYNAYPLDYHPEIASNGSTDWGGAAPPGQDFASLGSYNLSPQAIYELVRAENDHPDVAIQINHIGSHFSPLLLDSALVPPASGLTPGQLLANRLDPASGNLFHLFDALELWNGASAGAQRTFLRERIGIWMNLLNQGLVATAIADTDTHKLLNLETAGARTWTAASSDAPAAIDDGELARSVHAGRAVGGQGLYVQARLVAESTGQETGFRLDDPTLPVDAPGSTRRRPGVTTTDGEVHLDLTVQAPLWAAFDTIEIFVNAVPSPSPGNTTPPTRYTATPDRTLVAGLDFAIEEVDPYPADPIPDARRWQATHRETLSGLTGDAWVVVVARGSPAVPPMYPVYPFDLRSDSNVDPATGAPDLARLADSNTGEGGVGALGFTNALLVDVNGDGDFDPPVAAPGAP